MIGEKSKGGWGDRVDNRGMINLYDTVIHEWNVYLFYFVLLNKVSPCSLGDYYVVQAVLELIEIIVVF